VSPLNETLSKNFRASNYFSQHFRSFGDDYYRQMLSLSPVPPKLIGSYFESLKPLSE
jgi:hypothetical protein